MHVNNRKFMRAWDAQRGNCYDCGEYHVDPATLTLHHIPLVSEGGNDSSKDNVLLCRACHDKRHAMTSLLSANAAQNGAGLAAVRGAVPASETTPVGFEGNERSDGL